MSKLNKIGRLFTIKTRTEAWLVTYAIAVGAVERARHYVELYPGTMGLSAGTGLHRRGLHRRREAAGFGASGSGHREGRPSCPASSATAASAYS